MTKVTAEKRKRHIFKARIVGVLFILFLVGTYLIDKEAWVPDGSILRSTLISSGLRYVFPGLASASGELIVTIVLIILLLIFLDKITKFYDKE